MLRPYVIVICVAVSAMNLLAQAPVMPDDLSSSRPIPKMDPTAGDPIDLSSGLYTRTTVDLRVEDTIPIEISRTYRNADHRSRSFGVGTSQPYEMFIVGDAQSFTWVELILADGGRVHYNRISPGTSFADAVFEQTDSPSEFRGSRISWNGSGWTVALTDGSSYKILGCSPTTTNPGQCGEVEFRNADGQATEIERLQNGDISRVLSPNGKWVTFAYDQGDRVIRAEASTGDVVKYQYDGRGRLVNVLTMDKQYPVSHYIYDNDDRMVGIFESGEQIINTYDHELCTHQLWVGGEQSAEFDFRYVLDSQNRHIATEVREPNKSVHRVEFNANGYMVRDTYNVGQPDEASLIWDRDPKSNALKTFSVACPATGKTIQTEGPSETADADSIDTQKYVAMCKPDSQPQQ